MECKCESEEAATGWLTTGNLQMGAFTVVGYVLYRFSQTLPALIRWPIRLFCSITGLTTLWSWLSRLVGTLRVIKALYKYLSQFWHFLVRMSSRFNWLSRIARAVTGSGDDDLSDLRGLRVVLLRPCDAQSSSLGDFLLGTAPLTGSPPEGAPPSKGSPPEGAPPQSTKRTIVLSVGEVTIVEAPALPGLALENGSRAREALRSLQLCSPGPHAFFIETPLLNLDLQLDLSRGLRAAAQLFGEDVVEHVVPVVTHRHSYSRRKVEHLLRSQPSGHRRAPPQPPPRPEVVKISGERSGDDLNAARLRLLRRAAELKKTKGQFIHELQRQEERVLDQLLDHMAHKLATELGHAY